MQPSQPKGHTKKQRVWVIPSFCLSIQTEAVYYSSEWVCPMSGSSVDAFHFVRTDLPIRRTMNL